MNWYYIEKKIKECKAGIDTLQLGRDSCAYS